MNFFRTASTRRLITGTVLSAALVVGVVAAATAAGGGASPPPAKPLEAAIHDSLAAPKPAGITARVRFTNNLIASGALPLGSPLLTGASGRLWARATACASSCSRMRATRRSASPTGASRSTTPPATRSTAPPCRRRRTPAHAGNGTRRAEPPRRSPPPSTQLGAGRDDLGRRSDDAGGPARLRGLDHAEARRRPARPGAARLGRGQRRAAAHLAARPRAAARRCSRWT